MSRALVGAQRRLGVLAAHVRGMSSLDANDVEFSRCGVVGHAKLNRPKALNALNVSMLSKLALEFERWEADESVSVYLLSGNGGRAFCAGGDVRTLAQAATSGDDNTIKEFFQTEFSVDHQLATLRKPLVALVDNVYMGGGVGIASNAPVRIATERTTFAMPEPAIGFFPDVGVTHILSRMGNLGRFLALTGQSLRGGDVHRAGLATHFVPSENMPALVSDLESVSGGSDIEGVLSQYHKSSSAGGNESYLSKNSVHIEEYFSGESLLHILEKLEKDSNEFAKDAAAVLRSRCPLSLAVTWEQLRRNKDLSLYEVLCSDYRIALRMVYHAEFKEGIRAVLVDKDKNPKWTSRLETVNATPFFAPMKEGEGFQGGN